MPRTANKKRAPTQSELRVGQSLANWLRETGGEIITQQEQGRGRWLTTWRTPFGCLLVSTVDNRVAGIAAQIPHDTAGGMLDVLQAWASAAMYSPIRRRPR